MAQTGWKRPELGWSGRWSGRPYYSHYSKARESRERCQSLPKSAASFCCRQFLNSEHKACCLMWRLWKLKTTSASLWMLETASCSPFRTQRSVSDHKSIWTCRETPGNNPRISQQSFRWRPDAVAAGHGMWNPLKNPMAAEQQHLLHRPEDWMRKQSSHLQFLKWWAFAKQPRNWQQTAKQEMQRVWLAYRMTLPLAQSASSPNWLLNSKQCKWRAYMVTKI